MPLTFIAYWPHSHNRVISGVCGRFDAFLMIAIMIY
jgi:hypothetical protein